MSALLPSRARGGNRGGSDDSVGVSLLDVLAAVIITAGALTVFTRLIGWRGSTYAVLAHSALPITLLPVWLALAITAWRGHPIRFAMSLMLCIVYVFSVYPAVRSQPLSGFASGSIDTARTLKVFSANVYVDNETDFSRQILQQTADVFVFHELAKPIEAQLRRSGALNAYPYFAENGAEGTWRTVIFSRLPFATEPRSLSVSGSSGPGCPLVAVDVTLSGGTVVRIIGAHPVPLTVKGSDTAFVNTVRILQDEALRARSEKTLVGGTPLIIAGDFNGTRWLPVTGQLFDNGLRSTHEAMGYGLSASWPREMRFVPRFMRLDHAFFSGPIAPLSLHDVVIPGSDHSGFVASYVVGTDLSPLSSPAPAAD